MSLAENRLPDTIKAELIQLGLWAMRYSTQAMLNDLPVEPLITVNRNVQAGLLAQATQTATPSATHATPSHAV